MKTVMLPVDSITEAIIGDAIFVHSELGPGLLESTYETCLCAMLRARGFDVRRQVAMPVTFRGVELDTAYRIDLLVDGRVVVELKTVAAFAPVHFAQVLTYLKLSGCSVGLLINFNVTRLKDGLRRIVNKHPDAVSSAPSPSSADLGD